MKRYICIHGHFYQPPRENPWLEEVELQDSAYPYHDWNERITAECYAPNTASRIIDGNGKIADITNNYANISFNFGPTLLSWMEKHKPSVYRSIIEADVLSRERFSGHGSALAQVYNHMIMPLANLRDKYTQVIWGIKDFQKRFQRYPEGMWLSETAADTETLEILAELGIRFTILSPYQARRVRDLNNGDWWDISGGRIDPKMPYLCRLPSGRTITLFFYDGPISRDVAFGGVLNNGEQFANRLVSAFAANEDRPQLVHIATDGETYGHHHHFGDMALGYCLRAIEENDLAVITNYGEYLEKFPPSSEVEIFESSSWSCAHGIERWRDNCGCNSGMHPGWSQAWRKPLRDAMDGLRDTLTPLFENETKLYLRDPWTARYDYIDVIMDRSPENRQFFFTRHALRELSPEEQITVLKLMEMERNAMLMYTSCGWFFDELSGIETTQVLQYAGRAIQLAEEISGASIEPIFLKYLETAPSNIVEYGNGARIYQMFAKNAQVDFLRVAAHYAITALFDEYPRNARIYCYTTECEVFDKKEFGKLKRFVGKTWITSEITQEKKLIASAVVHLGDQNVDGGVRYYVDDGTFSHMYREVKETFDKGDMVAVLRLLGKHFGTHNYSLVDLFKDEQRRILNKIMKPILDRIELQSRQVCENNCLVMDFLMNLNIPIPHPFLMITGYRVNTDLMNLFEDERFETDKLRDLTAEVRKWNLEIDRPKIAYLASTWVNERMKRVEKEPADTSLLESIETVINLLTSISVELNLWQSQNIYYSIDRRLHEAPKEGEENVRLPGAMAEAFHKLGEQLQMKVQ